MEITELQRDAAFEAGTPVQQHLYGHADSGLSLRAIFTKHSLEESLYAPFVMVVGDVILDFYKQSELPQLLKTALAIDEARAIRLTADLLDFLSPLSDDTNGLPTATAPSLTSDIAEAEAALARVSPIRTMARDMNDLASQAPHEATAYQSTQPSSLRPAASGGTPPTSPSWGSQN